MAVKNYFSGVEGDQHFNAAMSAGAKHVLMSYLYLEDRGVKLLHDRKNQHPDLKVMIDSGAHTLQTNCHKAPYNTWKLADYERYLRKYVEWLKAQRDYVDVAVELDISYPLNVSVGKQGDDAYGHQIVEGWRRKYFAPLADQGIEIVYVWHGFNGLQGWEQMCSEYSYVGLPGELSSEKDFNKYLTAAKRFLTRIHGFAATKQADFRDWPWFSIDSTTWKSSERYGTLIDWDERKQKLGFFEKDKRPRFREKFLQNGFDADSIIKDTNYREVTRYALFSMVRMEDFYVRRFEDRVFYYELRLPPPSIVENWGPKQTAEQWAKFEPKRCFSRHSTETDTAKLRHYLIGISAVENLRLPFIQNDNVANEFLSVYFGSHMSANPKDMVKFRQDLSGLVMPRNKAAQARVSPEDYLPTNNPAKSRTERDWEIEELEFEVSRFPLDELTKLKSVHQASLLTN